MMMRKRKLYVTIVSWTAPVLLTFLVGLTMRMYVFEVIRIEGNSMNETLKSGDLVLVNKASYMLAASGRNDVVLARLPGGVLFVKRVIGLPGQTVKIADGVTYIDGEAVSEEFVMNVDTTEEYRITLGEDECLLLGDNRAKSHDSRSKDIGPVSMEALEGRVAFIMWPFSRFGAVE